MNAELKAVLEVYKPFKKHIYVSIACMAVVQALSVAYPFVAGKALKVLVYKKGLVNLAITVGVLVFILAVQLDASHFKDQYELNHLDFDVKRSMRSTTSKQMLSLSIGQHHSEHSGVKQRIVGEGEGAVINLWRISIYEIVPFIFEAGFCALACPFIDPLLGSFVLACVVFTYFLSKRVTKKYAGPIQNQDKAEDKTNKMAREIVQNVELIKLNSKEEFTVAEQGRLLREVSDGWKSIWIPFNRELWTMAMFPRNMRVVVMFLAGVRAYQGDITYGAALVLWKLSDNSIGRVGTMSYLQRSWLENASRIKRFVEFLGLSSDVKNAENPLRVPRFIGEIEFRDISFRYPTKPLMSDDGEGNKTPKPERDFAVSEVSFTLEPGSLYALVGQSGFGKSTIKHLLVRSYDPTLGVVKIDGNPLMHLDLELMRSRIGVVDQEVPLLDRSLRENLLFLLPEGITRTDKEIWQACEMACIDKFAHRLENGLDTRIGERGVKLSGGERQRVAIARCILKSPDIFIFDEATSALDALNEDGIVRSIKEISKGKTTLMIAHRFSTILSADEIIVMDKGKIVGQGKHRDLYVSCKAYEQLVGPQIRIVQELTAV